MGALGMGAAKGRLTVVKPDDWRVEIAPSEIVRRVMWGKKEVATINSRGDFTDATEQGLAAGIAHAAKMHNLLKRIRDYAVLEKEVEKAISDLLHSIETIDVGVMTEPQE